MTGVKDFLNDLRYHATNLVMFGDGSKSKVKGTGNLIGAEHPRLDYVLFVEGLTANLISISQLCDKNMTVIFTKTECMATNGKNEVLMKGVESKDNCYIWMPLKTTL